jgi:hypothetical protein
LNNISRYNASLSVPLSASLDDLKGVVTRSLEISKLGGKDYMAQTREAAQAILSIRHDLSLSDATYAVNYFREKILSES